MESYLKMHVHIEDKYIQLLKMICNDFKMHGRMTKGHWDSSPFNWPEMGSICHYF